MKADPYSIKRKPRAEQSFTFDDGFGFSATLNLRRFGVVGASAYQERGREMFEVYATGKGPVDEFGKIDTGHKNYVPPKMLPFVDGEPVFVTLSTCYIIAAVELAQTEGEESERYTFEDLAMMCVSDRIAQQIAEASAWVLPEDDDEGKSTDRQKLSLATASEGSSSTPNPSNETLNSSGASTSGLEAS